MVRIKTRRCPRCGKKVRLRKDGLIGPHTARTMASNIKQMRRPDLDDYIEMMLCPGTYGSPHKGRWRGEIGFIR